MRVMIIAVFVVAAFAAGAMLTQSARVSADEPPKRSQWQYQCFEASEVAKVTELSNKMGGQGWEMVTSAGTKGQTLWCFKRPLWKPTK